jgi:hypothetical protein
LDRMKIQDGEGRVEAAGQAPPESSPSEEPKTAAPSEK